MAVRGFAGPPLSVASHGASHGVTQHFVNFCAAATATDVARRPLAEALFAHPWLVEQGVDVFNNAACWSTVAEYLSGGGTAPGAVEGGAAKGGGDGGGAGATPSSDERRTYNAFGV